jgi:hypothetical protein
MTPLKKALFSALAFALAFALPLAAQEPWDPHLKLTAGTMGGAEENSLGQNKVYGLALAGAYPLTLSGFGVLEGGYKVFPTTSVAIVGNTTIDDLSDIYFMGAMYRHEIWRNGVYVQGGLRVCNTRTVRDIIRHGMGVDGKDDRERVRGTRETKAGWCFAVGFRLTDLWSFEIGASNASFTNLEGTPVGGTIIEAALCIHR